MSEAVDTLKDGGVIVFPTETSYGLAADATNPRAVERLLAIKKRKASQTLPLIVADMQMAKAYADLSPLLESFAKRFWPGALTIVAASRNQLDRHAVDRNGFIALRVSGSDVARALSKGLGKPIVSTSANRSGESDVYSIRAFRSQYATAKLQPDLILDAGTLPKRKPSTIIRETGGKIEVLRQGSIKIPMSYVA